MSFDVRTRLAKLRKSAKKRFINVNLDIERYQYVIDGGCYYCGDNLANENGYCLDRMDSNKGYTIQNVVGCCKHCNRAKGEMDVHDFVKWLHKASEHMKVFEKEMNEAKKLGLTEEMYMEICEKIMVEYTKDKPKERLKMINTDLIDK